jgi:GNAT superfamily N-acetyltransferase
MNNVTEFLRFVGDEPLAVTLEARIPTVEEYVDICSSSGLVLPHIDLIPKGLARSLYAVCATDAKRAIGFARVIGDGAIFFEIVDVGVRAEWQRQGIGSAIMHNVLLWLAEHAHPTSFVSLTPNIGSRGFYQRLGFIVRDADEAGMTHPNWAKTMTVPRQG